MVERLAPQAWMTAPATRAVIDALRAAGGDAPRFVGGCVRDALLGRVDPPDGSALDVDLATPLTPPAVLEALAAAGVRAIPTGLAHGVVTALARGRTFEIATLRRDVATDGRRAVVAFTHDWNADAARRDFRLNALYADADGAVYDPTGEGVADARAGRIVFVGDPRTRLAEDHLRSLRFFRFSAWYGHGAPDAAALKACAAQVEGLATLSGERVAKELLKLLAAPDPREAVRLMLATGVLAAILPGAEVAWLNALVALDLAENAPADAGLRLAALLPADAEIVRAVARRLRLPNALRDRLIATSDRAAAPHPRWTPAQVRAAIYTWGEAPFADRLRLAQAMDRSAPDWADIDAVAFRFVRPAFPVSGSDLLASGVAPGPQLGASLQALEAWWVASDFTADRSALLERLDLLA